MDCSGFLLKDLILRDANILLLDDIAGVTVVNATAVVAVSDAVVVVATAVVVVVVVATAVVVAVVVATAVADVVVAVVVVVVVLSRQKKLHQRRVVNGDGLRIATRRPQRIRIHNNVTTFRLHILLSRRRRRKVVEKLFEGIYLHRWNGRTVGAV